MIQKKICMFFSLCYILQLSSNQTCTDDSCTKIAKPNVQAPVSEFVFPINPDAILTVLDQILSMKEQIPVIIKVGASWCRPCRTSASDFEKIASGYRPVIDALFLTLTVDAKPALQSNPLQLLMQKLSIDINSIPAFVILYKNTINVIHGSDKVCNVNEYVQQLLHDYPRLPAITSASIQELVYASAQPVIVKVHAAWCAPCSYMESIFDQVAHDYKKKCSFYRLDTTAEPELAQKLMLKHHAEGIPLFLFFKNGIVIKKFSGIKKTKAEFAQEIDDFLKL